MPVRFLFILIQFFKIVFGQKKSFGCHRKFCFVFFVSSHVVSFGLLQYLFTYILIILFLESPKDILINSMLMALTGFFIGGPANLISAAISADLGCFFFFDLGPLGFHCT